MVVVKCNAECQSEIRVKALHILFASVGVGVGADTPPPVTAIKVAIK